MEEPGSRRWRIEHLNHEIDRQFDGPRLALDVTQPVDQLSDRGSSEVSTRSTRALPAGATIPAGPVLTARPISTSVQPEERDSTAATAASTTISISVDR
jgi:hypothetical protein